MSLAATHNHTPTLGQPATSAGAAQTVTGVCAHLPVHLLFFIYNSLIRGAFKLFIFIKL